MNDLKQHLLENINPSGAETEAWEKVKELLNEGNHLEKALEERTIEKSLREASAFC